MRKLYLFFLCIPFIGLGHILEAKHNDDVNSVFSLSAQQHYGFIIIHSRSIRAIKDSYPFGTELNFNWQKIDKKSWDLYHFYPRVGVVVSFFDFDNKEILGYGFTGGGFVEPYFRTNKKFNISFRIAAGLSFNTKPYDQYANPENLSYSLPINQYSQLGLLFHYRINQKTKLTLSSNYNHISNGGLKQPNKGINYPTLGFGLDYTPKPIAIENRQKRDFKGIKNRRYDISMFYFPKKILANAKYFTVFGVNTGISQQVGRISSLTVDLECMWDYSLKWEIEQLDSENNFNRVGLLLGHEFLMGRFTFSQKIGPYIYDINKFDDLLYQKYGINYHVTENFFTGLHIKAHRHIADFMSIKLGWTF